MVGDLISDVLAGLNAGCRSILVRSGPDHASRTPTLELATASYLDRSRLRGRSRDDPERSEEHVDEDPPDRRGRLRRQRLPSLAAPSRARSDRLRQPLEGNVAAVPDASQRLIVGDIAETDRLAQVLRQHRIEAVMHFAALASVPDSIADPEAYYRVNVLGTKSVLDAMRAAGVRKILFSSTAATYGFHSEMPLREDSPQLPETPYGTTKLAAEWLIKDYARAYGLGYTLLRYFNASRCRPRWRPRGRPPP